MPRYYEEDCYDEQDYEPEPDPETGFCEACGQEAIGVPVDVGIGPYEFWGHLATDVQIVLQTQCCEAPLLDKQPEMKDD